MDIESFGKKVIEQNGVTITCPNCHQKFTTHQTNQATCPYCGKTFKVNYHITAH